MRVFGEERRRSKQQRSSSSSSSSLFCTSSISSMIKIVSFLTIGSISFYGLYINSKNIIYFQTHQQQKQQVTLRDSSPSHETIIHVNENDIFYRPYSSSSSSSSSQQHDQRQRRLKIAIVSGFVPNQKSGMPPTKLSSNYLQNHVINQVCYADRWGYDYIFNSTNGFSEYTNNKNNNNNNNNNITNTTTKWWLIHGAWNIVPHMIAALPYYDWILYVDNDYAFQDMDVPLEYFINTWENHGLHNVSVFIPVDDNSRYTFSDFAVMIRNNEFGWRLLQNWYRFAMGLCPKGNFATQLQGYTWYDADQPGIWYALAKTHSEYFHGSKFDMPCDADTGIIRHEQTNYGGQIINKYFSSVSTVRGCCDSKDLKIIPKDQPILWSKLNVQNQSLNGLGMNLMMSPNAQDYRSHDLSGNFAIHFKGNFRIPRMKQDLFQCQTKRGCFAEYVSTTSNTAPISSSNNNNNNNNKNNDNVHEKLQIGCNRNRIGLQK